MRVYHNFLNLRYRYRSMINLIDRDIAVHVHAHVHGTRTYTVGSLFDLELKICTRTRIRTRIYSYTYAYARVHMYMHMGEIAFQLCKCRRSGAHVRISSRVEVLLQRARTLICTPPFHTLRQAPLLHRTLFPFCHPIYAFRSSCIRHHDMLR